MNIDASKMNHDGYNNGSVIGAAVAALEENETQPSFTINSMKAETGRVVDFYTAKDIMVAAAKEIGFRVKVETSSDDNGWSRCMVVHILM